LERLCKKLSERKITLTLTEDAKSLLAKRGFDPMYGARPLKRTIQSGLENPLAKQVISGTIHEGDTVNVDTSDKENLVITSKSSI